MLFNKLNWNVSKYCSRIGMYSKLGMVYHSTNADIFCFILLEEMLYPYHFIVNSILVIAIHLYIYINNKDYKIKFYQDTRRRIHIIIDDFLFPFLVGLFS